MRSRRGTIGFVLGAALALVAPAACDRSEGPSDEAAISVYAAASTANLVTAFARRYEETAGVRVRLNFAASSALARQIENGAPADVFLSAHPEWMDRLEKKGLVEPGTRRDLLGNGLVLVIPAKDYLGLTVNFRMDHRFDFAAAWTGRIAVADPEHVPAGIYARQALTALGWWDDVRGRLVPTADVRAAVRLVEMGEVQAGIAYASDVVAFPRVAAAATFPVESHEPIRYPVALRRGAGPAARAFLDAMRGPGFDALRERHGFAPPPRSP